MKKPFLILALVLIGLTTQAQSQKQAPGNTPVKPDTAKKKYNYFVTVPAQDYQQIASSLNEYKRLQMYDPIATPDNKVQLFQGIEKYLKELPARLRVDSVEIKK